MNIQNLMGQLMGASNPMSMMMSMLNPNQKQQANQLQNKSRQEQAEAIAQKCNELGISKEQLQGIISSFKK